jgi:hypothetical protein
MIGRSSCGREMTWRVFETYRLQREYARRRLEVRFEAVLMAQPREHTFMCCPSSCNEAHQSIVASIYGLRS